MNALSHAQGAPDGRLPAAFSLSVNAEVAQLGRITSWIEQAAATLGLKHATAFALQLCLEEAVSNIARHGRPSEAASLPVNLQLRAAPDRVTVTVEDPGKPFDPTTVPERPQPATVADAVVGGLGLRLMRQFSAGQRYERVGNLNRLILSFDA